MSEFVDATWSELWTRIEEGAVTEESKGALEEIQRRLVCRYCGSNVVECDRCADRRVLGDEEIQGAA